MTDAKNIDELFENYTTEGNHPESEYFELVKALLEVKKHSTDSATVDNAIRKVYDYVLDEIVSNENDPIEPVKFGTSGWRGMLGKDVFVRSVACVTQAIVDMYKTADSNMLEILGVASLEDACRRGAVVGHDNRFGGELLGRIVAHVLVTNGFQVYYAGESTTGALSAALLVKEAAFSVNLTPSHNPLEYGGYKYNAADGGPAAAELTSRITELANSLLQKGYIYDSLVSSGNQVSIPSESLELDALACWKQLVRENKDKHHVDFDSIVNRFVNEEDVVVVIDSVHGASRLDIVPLLGGYDGTKLTVLRNNDDPTFGGIAPEPSSANIKGVMKELSLRKEGLKIGAIIDPDGDRIRFTDGTNEISMNQFGAMAYHFLTRTHGLSGMVAKTVASSNLANNIAKGFGQEVFEPPVGFKEFKPVMGKALVFFEESDGISIIGHTPEKDAYIGLLLALDMVLSTGKNLGDYLSEIEQEFGTFYPARDGLVVQQKGEELMARLEQLNRYRAGSHVMIGDAQKQIVDVIDIDGRKMIFDDGSWLMIRPSGTEPKVRFYVESRTHEGTVHLVDAAKSMLHEIGLI